MPHRQAIVDLDPTTFLGPLALTVRDLPRVGAFYQRVLGLSLLATGQDAMVLGAADRTPLVSLLGRPTAQRPARTATGLFHLAIAFPTRADLAAWLRHAADLGLRMGQADHGTHEAFYFDDPEGNGIEVYADKPKEAWPMVDGRMVAFVTEAVDLPDLLASQGEPPKPFSGAPAGTRMMHVHLKVAEIARHRSFYEDTLGLARTAEMDSALFLAAGGYHHHLGMNTWHSASGLAPEPGAAGLHHYTLQLPGAAVLHGLAQRLREAGHPLVEDEGGLMLRDPSGNALLLRAGPTDASQALQDLGRPWQPAWGETAA